MFVSARTFTERRGILTANGTTDYLFGFSSIRVSAAGLEMPAGLTVGMIVDMWQQSPSDIGIFGLLGPDAPPAGWEANHVQTRPGRGWFPYFRAYGAEAAFLDGTYEYPIIERVDSFDR